MANEKLKRQKSPGIDQIPTEMIKVEGTKIRYKSINVLIVFGIRRNCLTSVMSPSFYLSIHSLVFSLEGQAWQEPEPSHMTGMALAHCILGKFLE